jgi:hypothetical protein
MSNKLDEIRIAIYLLAFLSLVSISSPAHASECLSSPGKSAPGRHWFYWTDKVSKQRCWFAKETAGRDSNQSSGGYEQALPVVPTEAESPVKSWFSSNFPTWNGWVASTEAEEAAPNEATLPRKRAANERNVKTSQQSKQKHNSERHVSGRTRQKATQRVGRVPETAGHKDVPDATFEFDKNWQSVIDAVREKDVRRTEVEEWQRALYEEFLVWRTKQIMFGYGD